MDAGIGRLFTLIIKFSFPLLWGRVLLMVCSLYYETTYKLCPKAFVEQFWSIKKALSFILFSVLFWGVGFFVCLFWVFCFGFLGFVFLFCFLGRRYSWLCRKTIYVEELACCWWFWRSCWVAPPPSLFQIFGVHFCNFSLCIQLCILAVIQNYCFLPFSQGQER